MQTKSGSLFGKWLEVYIWNKEGLIVNVVDNGRIIDSDRSTCSQAVPQTMVKTLMVGAGNKNKIVILTRTRRNKIHKKRNREQRSVHTISTCRFTIPIFSSIRLARQNPSCMCTTISTIGKHIHYYHIMRCSHSSIYKVTL